MTLIFTDFSYGCLTDHIWNWIDWILKNMESAWLLSTENEFFLFSAKSSLLFSSEILDLIQQKFYIDKY